MNVRKSLISILAFIITTSTTLGNVPIVFLHGWEGGAENWTQMTNLLVQSGNYSAEDLCPIDYWRSVDTPIETYAATVNDRIVAWLNNKGKLL